MTVTIDPRPTYFGDRMVVTGTYTGGNPTETINLASLFSRIDAFVVNPDVPVPQTWTQPMRPTALLSTTSIC